MSKSEIQKLVVTVSQEDYRRLRKILIDRGWTVSSFIRAAIKKAIDGNK